MIQLTEVGVMNEMAGYNSVMEMVAGRQQILCKIDEQNTNFRVLIKKKSHAH